MFLKRIELGVELSLSVRGFQQLQVLLFGDSTRCFGDEWLQQSLEFAREDCEVAYGLKQTKGGPCGVLAVTQAHLLKHLLWPRGQLEYVAVIHTSFRISSSAEKKSDTDSSSHRAFSTGM